MATLYPPAVVRPGVNSGSWHWLRCCNLNEFAPFRKLFCVDTPYSSLATDPGACPCRGELVLWDSVVRTRFQYADCGSPDLISYTSANVLRGLVVPHTFAISFWRPVSWRSEPRLCQPEQNRRVALPDIHQLLVDPLHSYTRSACFLEARRGPLVVTRCHHFPRPVSYCSIEDTGEAVEVRWPMASSCISVCFQEKFSSGEPSCLPVNQCDFSRPLLLAAVGSFPVVVLPLWFCTLVQNIRIARVFSHDDIELSRCLASPVCASVNIPEAHLRNQRLVPPNAA